MKHLRLSTAVVALTLALLLPTSVFAKGLDGFLGEINVSAKSDLGGFRADLSATFGVSSGEVDGLFRIFNSPADVYMTLRIGQVAHVRIGRVVDQYRSNKGQGWGVIAKNLGIKPGSAEFHRAQARSAQLAQARRQLRQVQVRSGAKVPASRRAASRPAEALRVVIWNP